MFAGIVNVFLVFVLFTIGGRIFKYHPMVLGDLGGMGGYVGGLGVSVRLGEGL